MHISFLFRTTFTLIVVLFTTAYFVFFSGKNLKNHYLAIAENQADKISSIVVLNSVSSLIKESYSQVSFLIDDEDIVFNTGELNALLKDAVNLSYKSLKEVENGTSELLQNEYGKGIIYEIPFNLFFDNVILATFGPKIPVRFNVIGDIKGSLSSEINNFGINNALINIILDISISSRISIPLTSKIVTNNIKMPVFSKVFTGEVPSLLYGNIEGVNAYYSHSEAI